MRFASSGVEPVDPQELLRRPSAGIGLFSCCDIVLSSSTDLVLQLHLRHYDWPVSVQFVGDLQFGAPHGDSVATVETHQRLDDVDQEKWSANSRVSVLARLLESSRIKSMLQCSSCV